jgi:cytochrome c oxidase cbb3-type subunit 3
MSTPLPDPSSHSRHKPQQTSRRKQWLSIIALAFAVIAAIAFYNVRTARVNTRLLVGSSTQLVAQPELIAYAARRGEPLYQEHCASCHGADLKGDRARGVPNLEDSVWLYDSGSISDIEQTILYGVRSGHPKSRNLAEMPGLGRIGQLNKADVQDVVEYVLKISNQAHDASAAERGKEVFANRGLCYDCHASDGYGVADYGTPALTGRGGSWLYGGDRATLYKSVFDGRHGLCPSWVNKLSFIDIRSVAVYLYARSHPNGASTHSQSSESTRVN